MPYPRAHWAVLVVIGVIAIGFWPSYFGAWDQARWQFHAHGIAASLWVIMVFAQSWTAHHRQLPLHRAIGRASLFLFPFLTGGLAAIIDVTAKRYVADADPVRLMFGGSFLIGMVVALAAYVTVYYRALKYRRQAWTHAGYMLTTPLILFESPFSRVLNMVMPGLVIAGVADLHLIMTSILLSMALELVVVALVWWKYRERAKPFLVAGGFIAVQLVAMGWLGDLPVLKTLLTALAQVPSVAVWGAGFALGALASRAGWTAGRRAPRPVAEAAQPA